MLEKTLESPLDCRDIKSILKEINPEYSLEGLMLNLKIWLTDWKNWLTGKDSDAGKDWRQEEKGTTEDEMIGWHHQLYRHEFEQALVVGDGQENLVCCSPWGCRVGHDWVTEMNWTELLCCGQIPYCLSHRGSLIHVRGRFPLIALAFYWQWFNRWHLYCSSWVIQRNLNLSFHTLRKRRCMQCILGRF